MPNSPQQTELHITTIEGMKMFMGHAATLQQAFSVAASNKQNNRVAQPIIEQGSRSYQRLIEVVRQSQANFAFNETPSTQTVLELQTLYDQLGDAYDELLLVSDVPLVMPNHTDVAARIDALLKRAETLLFQYEDIKIANPEDKDALQVGIVLYSQLENATSRVRQLLQTVSHRVNDVDLNQINSQTDALSTQIDTLDQGLDRFFEAEDHHGTIDNAALTHTKTAQKTDLFAKQLLGPAIAAVLKDPRYREYLTQKFPSPAAFEAFLYRDIHEVEKPQKLDTVLGIKHASVFDKVLRDKTIAEIEQFDKQSGEDLRTYLQEHDMRYEFYYEWMQLLSIMHKVIDVKPTMTFGELFVRSHAELLLHDES